ncbi:MAG TPA: hypothetical protein VGC34_16985 [Steroidobacteraceae bacterium]
MKSNRLQRFAVTLALLGSAGSAAAAGWSSAVMPTRAYSGNAGGSLQVQIFTVEPLVNPAGCTILDGYIITDPVIASASLATSLTAIAAGRQILVYVSDSCTLGRPTVTGVALT